MILGIIGKRGSGKTLTMVKAMSEYVKEGKIVYSNMSSFGSKGFTDKQKERIHLLSDDFFKNYRQYNLRNCGVFLDEIYVYIDSRTSMSKRNKIMSYFFNQTRKTGVDLYYTTQFFRQVDVRLRMNTEYFILPRKRKVGDELIIINRYVDANYFLKAKEAFLGNDYFKYYDTDEIINFETGE